MQDSSEDERIKRRIFPGPNQVIENAPVGRTGGDGTPTVLVEGTNEWVRVPGNEE